MKKEKSSFADFDLNGNLSDDVGIYSTHFRVFHSDEGSLGWKP